MINSQSRYRSNPVEKVVVSDGTFQKVIVPQQPSTYAFNYSYHLISASDRIDTLADRYFGDAELWWNIADANPEILDWTELLVGATIRIPNV